MACTNTELFRGAGEAYLATLDPTTKLPNSNFRPLGNTPLFTVNTSQDFEEVRESKTGNQQLIGYVSNSADTEVSLELNSFSKKNLEVAFYGTATDIVSGSVVGEAHTVYALNEGIILDNVKVSSVVVKDNLSATLTVDVDYTVDLVTGVITFIDATNITIPESITVDYSYAAQSKVEAFKNGQSEYAVKFIGKNIHDGKASKVSLYRVVLSASETLDLISDTTVTLAITGRALLDCNDNIMDIVNEA